jgi:predicted ATPase/DNA-binding CsgD family transcriptional regulator
VATNHYRGSAGYLPEAMTSFVGRQTEMAAAKLRMSESRLVTLIGAPGVGKTRLAIELAGGARRAFPDGVWMVDLASLNDPTNVAQTVLTTLGVADQSTRSLDEKLIGPLRERLALVLLDNCEHVLEETALLTAWLLRSCHKLHFLATSQEPLDIDGEYTFTLPPLSAPDPRFVPKLEAMSDYESVQLLVERVRAMRPAFEVTEDNRESVTQLCAQLDGLPLAIELAATRLRSLDVADVVKRLDSRFALLVGGHRDWWPRQQTLRALMDWSYERCTPEEKVLWMRMSVFTGSFDLDDAEEICSGEDLPHDAVAGVVDQLVSKSLIAIDQAEGRVRYRLLMTVRAYGAENLHAHGDAEDLRRRHRDHYLRIARAAADSFQLGHTESLARLRRDHPNLRAALAWSLSLPEEAQAGAALAGALQYHWFTDVLLSEGLGWLEQALEAAPDPTPERAEALWAAGLLALTKGQLDRTAAWFAECSRIGASLGDPSISARDAHGRAYVKLFSGDMAGSLELFETAIAGHRQAGEVAWELSAHYSAIIACAYAGSFERAHALSRDAIILCDRHGDRWARGFVNWATGVLEWREGNLDAARDLALAALDGERQLKRGLCVAYSLELLSWIAAATGSFERVARLQGAARAVWTAMGTEVRYGPQVRAESADALNLATEALGETRCELLLSGQEAMSIEDAAAFALESRDPCSQRATDGPDDALLPLSSREREVATLIASGKSNKAIAERLVLSPRTIDGHVERIFTKLGFQSRTQVATWISQRTQHDVERPEADRVPPDRVVGGVIYP